MWIFTNKQNRVIYYDFFNTTYLNSIVGSILEKKWINENIKSNKIDCIKFVLENSKLIEKQIDNLEDNNLRILNKKCVLLEKIHRNVEESRKPYEKILYAQDRVYEIKFNQAQSFINSNFNKNLLSQLPFLQDEIYIQNTTPEITALLIQKTYHECINILRCSERTRRIYTERVLLCNDLSALLNLEQQINIIKNFQLIID